VGWLVRKRGAEGGGTYVAGDLLGEHVVVTLPGCGGEVVGVPGADTTVRVSLMSTNHVWLAYLKLEYP
jgi:hypothetical protein